jgi:hypothetical protein
VRDLGDAIIMALFLFAFFGIGAWLEQGGKSDPEDYSDDD